MQPSTNGLDACPTTQTATAGFGSMRAVLALVLVASTAFAGCLGAQANRGGSEPDPPLGADPGGSNDADAFVASRSCVDVDVAGTDSTVVGTAVIPTSVPPTILVLVPGANSPRDIFDFGDESTSMQKYLAARGVATFAIDRPGMGESVYAGPPITFDDMLDVIDQVVAAMRAGAWAADSGCHATSIGFSHVLVGGHSLGGILSVHYAATRTGADGIVPMGTPFTGANKLALGAILYCLATTSDPPLEGPGNAICDGSPEALPGCETGAVYAPTANAAAAAAFCDAARAQPDSLSPRQILTGFTTLDAKILDVEVPGHIVFYGKDWFLYDEGFEQENIANALMMWEHCAGCSVSSTVVANTGHLFPVHSGQGVGYQGVVDWMSASGFA